MGKVLSIAYRAIGTHLRRKAGYTTATAQTGAVTLIQRIGGAVNLNIHFHMLSLEGVYIDGSIQCVVNPSSWILRSPPGRAGAKTHNRPPRVHTGAAVGALAGRCPKGAECLR